MKLFDGVYTKIELLIYNSIHTVHSSIVETFKTSTNYINMQMLPYYLKCTLPSIKQAVFQYTLPYCHENKTN